MSGTQLVLHCGAKEVSRNELATVEAPPPTKTWFPIKHSDVLDAVLETVDRTGFAVEKMRSPSPARGAQFFGTLDLRCPIAEGVSLAVGIRNSTNQTLPLGFVAGTRVFVCDNLAFRSELLVNRKHTLNGGARFNEAIVHAVRGLEAFRDVESRRVELMRVAEISDVEAESLILRAYERRIVSHRLLPDVIRGWREPGHDDFRARTTWSLYNAVTGAPGRPGTLQPPAARGTDHALAALLTPRRTDAHGTHEDPAAPSRGDTHEEPEPQDEQPRRPVQEYRLGRVKAVIWLNETQLGARHSVQFFRLYKPEGAEHWQSTTSFNRDDLPLVAKLADMAMMYVYGAMQSEGI